MSSISAPAKPTLCTPPAINTLEDTLQTMESSQLIEVYTSQVIVTFLRKKYHQLHEQQRNVFALN